MRRLSVRRAKQLAILAIVLLCVLVAQTIQSHERSVAPNAWEREKSAGVIALDAARFDDAERRFRSAPKLAAGAYEEGTTLQNLGDLRSAQHRFSDARDSYARALAMLDGHPYTSQRQRGLCLSGYGRALVASSQFAEAEPVLRRSLEINSRERGTDDSCVRGDWRVLAADLLALGRPIEAAEAAKHVNDGATTNPSTTRLR